MSIIPLHIQRRFEQRWAARFGSLAIPAVPKNPGLKGSPGKTRRARQKPTRVRYSGVSFVYQASGIFASGLTPIIATWLLAAGGNRPWLVCGYVRNRAAGPGYDVTRAAMQRPRTLSAKHIGRLSALRTDSSRAGEPRRTRGNA